MHDVPFNAFGSLLGSRPSGPIGAGDDLDPWMGAGCADHLAHLTTASSCSDMTQIRDNADSERLCMWVWQR